MEQNELMETALNYVREWLGDAKLNIVRLQADLCWENRWPIKTDYNDDVRDLLNEFGSDRNMSEEWWEKYGDLEDIISDL